MGVGFSAKTTSGYSGPPKWPETYFDFHSETTFSITVDGGNHEDVSWRDHIILRRMMRILKLYLENSTGKIILRPSPFEDINEFIFLKNAFPPKKLLAPGTNPQLPQLPPQPPSHQIIHYVPSLFTERYLTRFSFSHSTLLNNFDVIF